MTMKSLIIEQVDKVHDQKWAFTIAHKIAVAITQK